MSEAIELFIAARTEVGKIRGHNEDDFLVCRNLDANEWFFDSKPALIGNRGALAAIADGMGGEKAGEIASRISMEIVKQRFSNLPLQSYTDREACELLEDIIINAHKEIITDAIQNPTHSRMGTTIVLTWIVNQSAHIAWVGDSRCYLLRSGRLSLLTDDHAPVWDMVRKGKISADEARAHPDSNFISQHLGQKKEALKPDTKTLMLQANDTVLLCSDGLNSMISDTQIEAILNESDTLQTSASNLVIAANDAGGYDNITVLLFKVNGEEVSKAGFSKTQAQKTVNHDLDSIPEMPPLPKERKGINVIGWLIIIAVIFFIGWLTKNIYQKSFTKSEIPSETESITITEEPPPSSDTPINQINFQQKPNYASDTGSSFLTSSVSSEEGSPIDAKSELREYNSLLKRKDELKQKKISACRNTQELIETQKKVDNLYSRFLKIFEFNNNQNEVIARKKSATITDISNLEKDITAYERVYNLYCSDRLPNQPKKTEKLDKIKLEDPLPKALPKMDQHNDSLSKQSLHQVKVPNDSLGN